MSRKYFKRLFRRQNKKTSLHVYVYDFIVDHNAIAVDDILDIHKYLMKKNGIVQMFGYIKIFFKGMNFLVALHQSVFQWLIKSVK